ncbi:MAG: cold shock domain-containing protein [Bacteroidetes bacterium]|nr:cold shock domain-containing protein [Bacteroidota bacterium]
MKKLFAFVFLLTAVVSFANPGTGQPCVFPIPCAEDTCAAQPEKTVPERGTVKWFNEAKGYGFIVRERGSDVFVHHTNIITEGFRTLSVGDRVRFEVVEGPKGVQAKNVVKLV